MSNYDSKCWMCFVLVYVVPIIATIVVAIIFWFMIHEISAILVALITGLIMQPLLWKLGKTVPMLHEYFKEQS